MGIENPKGKKDKKRRKEKGKARTMMGGMDTQTM